jgi:UDP-N-acetylmuramate dehydrogenase
MSGCRAFSRSPNYNEYPNNGSFFKNPIIPKDAGERLKARYPDIQLIDQHDAYKVPAAWLIEHMAQCKGVKEEDIGTWPNQPLVIVNYGNASAKDILDFSEKIITKIEAATGIRLEREVNFVG